MVFINGEDKQSENADSKMAACELWKEIEPLTQALINIGFCLPYHPIPGTLPGPPPSTFDGWGWFAG